MDVLFKKKSIARSEGGLGKTFARRVISTLIFGCLIALVVSPAAFAAEPTGVQVELSPFTGTGKTSTGNAISNNTGMGLSAALPLRTAPRTTIGPRIEAINSLINTSYDGSDSLSAAYDHRIFAAGIVADMLLGSSPKSMYGALSAGKVYSKLVLDESSEQSFTQTSYTGINGDYLAGEAGIRLPVRDTFRITLGLAASMIKISQNVVGRGEGEQVVGRAYLTGPAEQNATEVLPRSVVQKTLAAKAGFSIGF